MMAFCAIVLLITSTLRLHCLTCSCMVILTYTCSKIIFWKENTTGNSKLSPASAGFFFAQIFVRYRLMPVTYAARSAARYHEAIYQSDASDLSSDADSALCCMLYRRITMLFVRKVLKSSFFPKKNRTLPNRCNALYLALSIGI